MQRRTTARSFALALVPVAAALAAGCGGSGDRQDKDEPTGEFAVTVEEATFPLRQQLAQSSTMKIVVRNSGNQPIPNIAVTVQCEDSQGGQNGSFDRQIASREAADKNRPNFVVDRIPGPDRPESAEQPLDPLERSSAYVNTYTLGTLAPNRTATFEWDVTAVRAGDFRLCYRVAAGLDGKAKAVAAEGSEPLADEWNGVVESEAPKTGVADDGETITTLPGETEPAP